MKCIMLSYNFCALDFDVIFYTIFLYYYCVCLCVHVHKHNKIYNEDYFEGVFMFCGKKWNLLLCIRIY